MNQKRPERGQPCPQVPRRWHWIARTWLSALRATDSWKALPFLFFLASATLASAAAEWESGPGFRSKKLDVTPTNKTGFTRLTSAETGIQFTNLIALSRHLTNQILLNGSGVAAGDVDGDGWCDLYFCGLDSPNALYRNLGNWKFENVTAQAGVACSNLDATGAALADIDGDGDLDLIVNSVGGGTHVFSNDGRGHFREVAQLNGGKGGTSLALADIDGDGFLDLYVANYRTSALMDLPNARATFKMVDGRSVVDRLNGRPVTEPDLVDRFIVDDRGRVVEQGEVDALYRNQGGTNFVPVSFTGGAFLDEDGKPLSQPPFDWGLTVQFRDLNGDGRPDIYVCNDFDSPDRLWINLGAGRFQAAPRLALRKSSMFSMGVDFADINRDGFVDFLVLDMLSRDHRQRLTQMGEAPPPTAVTSQIEARPQYGFNMLYLNRGDGTFAEVALLSGLEAAEWSWSPVFLDVDLDGWEDVLISNGQERAARDHDVAERLKKMRAAKRMSDAEIFQARKMFPRQATANLAFRNRGNLTFEEVGRSWGFDFAGVSHGMALADLDNDGDLDVVVNNLNDAPGIHRNETSAPRVAVRLKGVPPNTRGIGAKIQIFGGAVPQQSQEMIAGGRYLSSDDPLRVFAAGGATNRMQIEVRWRGGKRSLIANAQANRIYEIAEDHGTRAGASTDNGQRTTDKTQGPKSKVQSPKSENSVSRFTFHASPIFQDASERIAHTHHDDPFDDFLRQPLLPNRLSQLGPGVTWFDLDGDGWEDLIIGSGKGGTMGVYRNDGRGGFKRLEGPLWATPITRDQTAVLGWRSGTATRLLAGSANYEDGLIVGSCVRQFDLARNAIDDSLPPSPSSSGPLALGDVDGDGDLDLFVGGRVFPGKYPRVASSVLFRNIDGKFEIDFENTKRLAGIGLVSGAVFSDLDGDGDPDLILACDWGPILIYRNEAGALQPWNWPVTLAQGSSDRNPQDSTFNVQRSTFNAQLSQLSTLSQLTGWWNGVTTGDLDGDGKLDIIASNWGRNTIYESHRSKPLLVLYGDLDADGRNDIVEAYYDAPMEKLVPERSLASMAQALPFLRDRFATHRAYAEASLEEILGERIQNTKTREVHWLESTIFLNRGQHFEVQALPVEAQMAPAFGVCVGDYDGDGHEDIFLSQNFFATQPETPRSDAGRGLWLRGDGRGGFRAVPGQESGVRVYGEQRGCALGDYDRDGRVDLVVAQNGAATKLFHNVGAKPGLGVRLKGSENNPSGIGASVRLVFGNRFGPVREVHAGSGYWSQESATLVLSIPEPPTQLWVRWPGGKITTADLPAQAREILADAAGRITVLK